MIKKLSTLFFLLFFSGAALGGPIFSLIGPGGNLHPDGDGLVDRMVLSNRFGISGSGGGFMDGRLTLVDGFVLPTLPGGTTTIDASDIQEFSFRHVEPISTSSIYPYINILATAADIVSASGTIVFDSGGYRFTNASATGDLKIQTSITSSWFVPLYGGVTGDWRIDGSNVYVGDSGLGLIQSNLAKGGYKMTGTSSVPEPSALFMLMSGLLMLGVRRKKLRELVS